MLHIEAEQVDLVLGQRADLHLQIIKRRDGAAANVIAHAPPFHAGPVADDQSRNSERLSSRAFGAQQLAERLHAIEQPLRGAPCDQHSGVGHSDHVALFIKIMTSKIIADFHSLRFEIGPQAAVSQAAERDVPRRFWRVRHKVDRQLHAGAVVNLSLQSLSRSSVFGIADEDGGRWLDHDSTFRHAGLFRSWQKLECANVVVDLGVRSERQAG